MGPINRGPPTSGPDIVGFPNPLKQMVEEAKEWSKNKIEEMERPERGMKLGKTNVNETKGQGSNDHAQKSNIFSFERDGREETKERKGKEGKERQGQAMNRTRTGKGKQGKEGRERIGKEGKGRPG